MVAGVRGGVAADCVNPVYHFGWHPPAVFVDQRIAWCVRGERRTRVLAGGRAPRAGVVGARGARDLPSSNVCTGYANLARSSLAPDRERSVRVGYSTGLAGVAQTLLWTSVYDGQARHQALPSAVIWGLWGAV